jgi:hypothetical protein
MKKVLLLVFLSTAGIAAFSQEFRINLYGAYTFDDSYNEAIDANTYYNGKITGGIQWGGGIQYLPHPQYGVELLYFQRNSEAPTNFKTGNTQPAQKETFDIALHYIMLSGDGHKKSASGKVEGYGGFMLGMVISDAESPSTGGSASNSNFAWGARLGANIWASSKVGIKLQALLLSSARAAGGELYFGYWGPVVLSDYAVTYQFSLGGGLTFRLGK